MFWQNIDPTVKDRQFCDVGSQYRTGDLLSLRGAEAPRRGLEGGAGEDASRSRTPIVTPVAAAGEFWPAEEYHQDYYKKNPVRYSYYRTGCGRDARLKELWGRGA